jgi:hypothetical protein
MNYAAVTRVATVTRLEPGSQKLKLGGRKQRQ